MVRTLICLKQNSLEPMHHQHWFMPDELQLSPSDTQCQKYIVYQLTKWWWAVVEVWYSNGCFL